MTLVSDFLASIASIASGADNKATILFIFKDVKCPKELL